MKKKTCSANEELFYIGKGWLAIAKLKPLSLFISLFQHFQMLSKAFINGEIKSLKEKGGLELSINFLFPMAFAIPPLTPGIP